MRFLFRSLLLSFLLSASLRGAWGEEPPIRFEASHDAMGTQFTIVAYGTDARFLAQVANEAFEEIDSLDAQMSNYKPESELSRINRDAAHEAVLVEPRLFQLIADSIRGSEETGGAFDITVGPLMKAWGFFRGQGRVPTAQELSRVMKHVGYHHVQLDPEKRTIRFDVAGLELDLGGVAKGYAVDRAVDILRANGVTIALVSSGTSSIYALGAPPGERAWRVTLRDPFHADKAGDVAYLKNYSFSASGNYETFFTLGGKTYSHIMDPRTGRPVENMLSTAVLAPRGVDSDMLSKFYVLGVEGSRKVLARHPRLVVIFYRSAGSKQEYERVVLRSPSFDLPSGSLAEVAGTNSRPPRSE
ncbi:MAG: FAD:protein FMN transferase [Terriglobia bacterium]|jgi:thiamine biosynthesis lipoprotein